MACQSVWIQCLLLLFVVAVAAAAAGPGAALADEGEAGSGDSLKSALQAVNRRQRDLAALGGSVAGTPLADYRFRPEAEGDLAFLSPPRDFAGDGQPENIGYGYQKSASAAAGGEGGPAGRAAERVLLDYLEANGGLPDAPGFAAGYPPALPPGFPPGAGLSPSDKRAASVFRERTGALRAPLVLRKRKGLARPSSFRERARAADAFGPLGVLQKRERGAEELLRAAEAAEEAEEREREEEAEEAEEVQEAEAAEQLEEERRRRQEQEEEQEEREDEYLLMLQDLWHKFQAYDPEARADQLSPQELQELLAGVADRGDMDKRQYGGFDYFNNAGALGGWQAGGMYRKRSGVGAGRQRLEGPGAGAGAGFLYALKFASPAAQREALEALAEEDAAEMGDERDADAIRAAATAAFEAAAANDAGAEGRRLTAAEWHRAAQEVADAEAEAAEEEAFGPAPAAPEDYQRLLAEAGTMGPSVHKRALRKRFLYDGALLGQRKRYPVTKRSSDFYANPPLMHRRGAAPGAERLLDERRRKKDASNAPTDPKVASELNQIFGGEGHDEPRSTTATPEPVSGTGGAAPASAPPSASPTAERPPQSPANGSRELTPEEQRARNEQHNADDGSGAGSDGGHSEEEAPLALSRVQDAPHLEVKKKSVDWSQYFGLDRRRKKSGSSAEEQDSRWLLDRYRAMALAAAHKRGGGPALDTRRFNAGGDIFTRSSRQKTPDSGARLDGVDTKLRGMEDLIVNEAVKLTGAHQGATDPEEVQQVKDRILSRLAAAYSLEKMRLALREFKSSLQAQKMSKYNPENQQSDEDKKKRVAVKKEKAEEKEDDKDDDEIEGSVEEEDEEKKKRIAVKKTGGEERTDGGDALEFLGASRGIEPMSEGYMGRPRSNALGDDCTVVENVEMKCRAVSAAAGDSGGAFTPLCTLHQICHICGPAVGASSGAACDTLFAREAALGCGDDPTCALTARRTAALLPRPPPPGAVLASADRCWPGSCLVQRFLAATMGARLR